MKENIQYKILKEPNASIFDLLKNTTYGTKGLKIKHLDTDKKLSELQQPEFHTLWKNDQLLAVAAYCKRITHIQNNPIAAYYIRYFSVSKKHRGKGFGKLLTKHIEQHYKTTIKDKTIFYAYIEDQNLQSKGVSKHFQMNHLGKFTTLFFSRFLPKTGTSCHKATKEDLKKVNELLKHQYQSHATTQFIRVGYEDNYYVYKENNQIIAGAQAINTRWKMENIPGFTGWLALHILPHIPIINRVIPGENLNFIGIEGVYLQSERTDALIRLIEHILAENKLHNAFLYFDTKEKTIHTLKSKERLGFLSKIQKSPTVSISNQALFLSKKEQELLTSLPKYISAYDIT